MLLWRVVLAKIVTLGELKTSWSFKDLIEANVILNIKEQIEEEQLEKMKADRK